MPESNLGGQVRYERHACFLAREGNNPEEAFFSLLASFWTAFDQEVYANKDEACLVQDERNAVRLLVQRPVSLEYILGPCLGFWRL